MSTETAEEPIAEATALKLPVGTVFWGYYYPPTFGLPPYKKKLARMQFIRGRSIVFGERAEYALGQRWERIEIIWLPVGTKVSETEKGN